MICFIIIVVNWYQNVFGVFRFCSGNDLFIGSFCLLRYVDEFVYIFVIVVDCLDDFGILQLGCNQIYFGDDFIFGNCIDYIFG